MTVKGLAAKEAWCEGKGLGRNGGKVARKGLRSNGAKRIDGIRRRREGLINEGIWGKGSLGRRNIFWACERGVVLHTVG